MLMYGNLLYLHVVHATGIISKQEISLSYNIFSRWQDSIHRQIRYNAIILGKQKVAVYRELTVYDFQNRSKLSSSIYEKKRRTKQSVYYYSISYIYIGIKCKLNSTSHEIYTPNAFQQLTFLYPNANDLW
jgi:hypothetical protein